MSIAPDHPVILHIGLHKTATTFLQLQYFRQLEGVSLYAEPKFHDRLGTISPASRWLISSEGMSGVAWNREWKNGIPNPHHWIHSFKIAVQNCRLIYPHASVVIVFRRHGDLLLSLYKQYVQEGGILPLRDFYGPEGVIREEDLSYEARWEVLKENFGQVYALDFERFRQEGVAYFDRFFSAIGLKRTQAGHAGLQQRNISITGVKVEMLRRINGCYRYAPENLKRLMQMAGMTPRQIMQKRLSFWKPADPPGFIQLQQQVNDKMAADWEYIESVFFK